MLKLDLLKRFILIFCVLSFLLCVYFVALGKTYLRSKSSGKSRIKWGFLNIWNFRTANFIHYNADCIMGTSVH